MGLWDRPCLHAEPNPLVARPIRLARARGATERVFAIRSAVARDRRAFHSSRRKGAGPDAATNNGCLTGSRPKSGRRRSMRSNKRPNLSAMFASQKNRTRYATGREWKGGSLSREGQTLVQIRSLLNSNSERADRRARERVSALVAYFTREFANNFARVGYAST